MSAGIMTVPDDKTRKLQNAMRRAQGQLAPMFASAAISWDNCLALEDSLRRIVDVEFPWPYDLQVSPGKTTFVIKYQPKRILLI